MHHTMHPRFRATVCGHTRHMQPLDAEGHPVRIVRHAGGRLSLQRVGGIVAHSVSHAVRSKGAKKKAGGSVRILRRALRK